MKPPKYYSIEQSNYNPELGARLIIFLDGVEQIYTVAYTPYSVTRFVTDSEGGLVVSNGEVKIETVSGEVKVIYKG